MDVDGYGGFSRSDIASIERQTKLSSVYMQQCRDQALWMWRGYRVQLGEWNRKLEQSEGKRREKIVRREPHKPFHAGLINKIPVRIDSRSGTIEHSKSIKISQYVLRLSTMKKYHRITIPLNPAEYHLDLLEKGRIVDFQLVKKNHWYSAHICVKYNAPDLPARAVLGVDLGVRRAVATVLLTSERRMRPSDLSILRDGERRNRLDQLNRRIAQLQRAKKWTALKRLSRKRRDVAAYHARTSAICIAKMAEREHAMVAVGYPRGMKYENYRGNGKPHQRRMLQQRFSYARQIQLIHEECAERGIRAQHLLEAWTSRQCHRCGSINTRRPTQSLFWCLNCGSRYNADWNGAINIGSVFFAARLSRQAIEGLAYARDELAYKPASLETRNLKKMKTTVNSFG